MGGTVTTLEPVPSSSSRRSASVTTSPDGTMDTSIESTTAPARNTSCAAPYRLCAWIVESRSVNREGSRDTSSGSSVRTFPFWSMSRIGTVRVDCGWSRKPDSSGSNRNGAPGRIVAVTSAVRSVSGTVTRRVTLPARGPYLTLAAAFPSSSVVTTVAGCKEAPSVAAGTWPVSVGTTANPTGTLAAGAPSLSVTWTKRDWLAMAYAVSGPGCVRTVRRGGSDWGFGSGAAGPWTGAVVGARNSRRKEGPCARRSMSRGCGRTAGKTQRRESRWCFHSPCGLATSTKVSEPAPSRPAGEGFRTVRVWQEEPSFRHSCAEAHRAPTDRVRQAERHLYFREQEELPLPAP